MLKIFNKEWFSFKPSSVLGVDISGAAVKVVELSQYKGTYELTAYSRVRLPSHAVVEKEIRNTDAVTLALKEALFLSRATSKAAVVALADSSVITKQVSLDKNLSELELDQSILTAAETCIPYPIEEICLDYLPIKEQTEKSIKQKYFLVAAKETNVATYYQVLENVGLKAQLIDIESFIMLRACEAFVREFKMTEITAVIDIGTVRTTTVIYENSIPVFTRAELFGTEFLEKDVSTDELDFLNYINKPDEDLYEDFKQSAVKNIKRSLQIYISGQNTKAVEKIVLSGGLAYLKGLAKLLQDELGTRVVVANPITSLHIGPKVNSALITRASPALMIVLGLALRGFDK